MKFLKTLYDYIQLSVDTTLIKQHKTGYFFSGHNGPYFDQETPVRNTGHWLIAFLKVYDITKNKKYLDAAEKAIKYLLSKEARPMNAAFWHRKNPKKDFSNGLIGQAWSIEALSVAAQYFDNSEIIKTARDVFFMHPFNEKTGLWQRVGVDGSHLSIDGTFNHQLWFAASAGLLEAQCKDKEISGRIKIFMDNLDKNLALYFSGLIVHRSKPRDTVGIIKNLLRCFKNYSFQKEKLRSVGYHQFNLYAFALLKAYIPGHHFWKSKKFKKLWQYANTDVYKRALNNNEFGYPYNPPGFEMAYTLEVFGATIPDKKKKQKDWVLGQIKRSFDFDSGFMSKNTKDSETLSARIYEATRLPDLSIELSPND